MIIMSETEKYPCLLCGQSDSRVIFQEAAGTIRRCSACGHIFSAAGARPATGYFPDSIAAADHFWWREAHAKMYQAFGRRFLAGRSGRLLDAGCGLGYFLSHLVAYPDWEAWGTEISPAAVDFARDTLDLGRIVEADLARADFPDRHFDLITLWDVLEHLPDPRPVLANLRAWLKDDGWIFIHTPNISIQLPKARLKKFFARGRPGHYLEATDHRHHYSPVTLRRLVEMLDLEMVELIHLPPIQSVSGRRSALGRVLKNFWYWSALGLDKLTAGAVRLDNLFAVVKKS